MAQHQLEPMRRYDIYARFADRHLRTCAERAVYLTLVSQEAQSWSPAEMARAQQLDERETERILEAYEASGYRREAESPRRTPLPVALRYELPLRQRERLARVGRPGVRHARHQREPLPCQGQIRPPQEVLLPAMPGDLQRHARCARRPAGQRGRRRLAAVPLAGWHLPVHVRRQAGWRRLPGRQAATGPHQQQIPSFTPRRRDPGLLPAADHHLLGGAKSIRVRIASSARPGPHLEPVPSGTNGASTVAAS